MHYKGSIRRIKNGLLVIHSKGFDFDGNDFVLKNCFQFEKYLNNYVFYKDLCSLFEVIKSQVEAYDDESKKYERLCFFDFEIKLLLHYKARLIPISNGYLVNYSKLMNKNNEDLLSSCEDSKGKFNRNTYFCKNLTSFFENIQPLVLEQQDNPALKCFEFKLVEI